MEQLTSGNLICMFMQNLNKNSVSKQNNLWEAKLQDFNWKHAFGN